MKSFLKSFFACLLAILVLLLILIGVGATKANQKPKIEDHAYLVIDVYGDILESGPPGGVMGQIMGGSPETLQRILDNLQKAAVDERIIGVILKLSSANNAGLAKIEEIRGAIRTVQAAGKPILGYTDTMNSRTYLLAAACDTIYAPPSAYIDFVGLRATSQHIKKTLEKLGIRANLHKIKDYKSAAEAILREDMSDAARENRRWMLREYWEIYTEALLNDRGLTEEQIVARMQHAAFTAEEARTGGLIDEVLYWDALEERLKRPDDDELRTVCQCDYEQVEFGKLGLKGKKKIAVIHAQGMIGGRESRAHPLQGLMIGHETVVADLKAAREDDDVVAVILRIDSGGGEALGSDLMGHAVELTTHVKPVVASMVDMAASGGYHMAYRANKIVASPMTLTGSIGSISGKINMHGLYDKLGITMDFETKGPMAMMWSDYRDFTEEERERFEDNHWKGFNDWLRDVADHRGMSFEEAESLAEGRVWSGRQAKENGLIDELGGLTRAIEVAKELAEVPTDEKVTLVHYPETKGFFEELMSGGGFQATAEWIIYHQIKEELISARDALTTGRMYKMDEFTIE